MPPVGRDARIRCAAKTRRPTNCGSLAGPVDHDEVPRLPQLWKIQERTGIRNAERCVNLAGDQHLFLRDRLRLAAEDETASVKGLRHQQTVTHEDQMATVGFSTWQIRAS